MLKNKNLFRKTSMLSILRWLSFLCVSVLLVHARAPTPLFARAVHREVNHLLYDPETHDARDDTIDLALLTVYFDQPLYLETWVQVTKNKTDGNFTSAEKTAPKWRPQRIPLLQVLQELFR